MDHRLEHLSRGDNGFSIPACPVDDGLLYEGHLLQRHLNPEVATCHHHPIGSSEDAVEILPRLRLFDFGNNAGGGASLV